MESQQLAAVITERLTEAMTLGILDRPYRLEYGWVGDTGCTGEKRLFQWRICWNCPVRLEVVVESEEIAVRVQVKRDGVHFLAAAQLLSS